MPREGDIRPSEARDAIDDLGDRCRAFCDALPRSPQVALARAKFDEALYWLRAARDSRWTPEMFAAPPAPATKEEAAG